MKKYLQVLIFVIFAGVPSVLGWSNLCGNAMGCVSLYGPPPPTWSFRTDTPFGIRRVYLPPPSFVPPPIVQQHFFNSFNNINGFFDPFGRRMLQ